MSQFPQSFRSPSPATGPQAVRVQERKGPVGASPSMMAQQRPKTACAAGAKNNQSANRISPVSGPPSNVNSRRSPVTQGASTSERSGAVGGGVGAFEVRAPAAAKQKRSTLAQGSATAGRRPSVAAGGVGGGYGNFNISISANGTPRAQYSETVAPQGQGTPYTPSVTVNPNFDGSKSSKSSLGLRHHNGVKAGGFCYEVGPDPLLCEAGPSSRQRSTHLPMHAGARRSMSAAGGSSLLGTAVLESGGISLGNSASQEWAYRGSEVGGAAGGGGSVEQQRQSITQAIGLLENSQLLQQDAVLRDIVQIIVNRLHASPRKQQNSPQRVVVTTEHGTQVQSVETATQTDGNLGRFREKRIKPLAKGKLRRGFGDGHSCSLSDSDVPSDQTGGEGDSHGMGRRRNSLDDISLSTNSPRESCDGYYSRDTSEASGPVSVSSMVQMSVASSTDASQAGTLAPEHMTPSLMHAKHLPAEELVGGGQGELDGVARVEGREERMELWDKSGNRAEGGEGLASEALHAEVDAAVQSSANGSVGKVGSPMMSPLQAINVNLNHYIGTYQSELEGISEVAHSPDGASLSPSEKQYFNDIAMSPSPSIETLKELKRILDHHYTKLCQAGNLAAAYGINSPATAEMRRLTMESQSGLAGEGDGARALDADTEAPSVEERPPNPDPTKRSPGCPAQLPSVPPPAVDEAAVATACIIPCNVRMGNSPPKHKNVKTPLTQLRSVPTLNLPSAKRLDSGNLESPLSTPRSGSAFLAHINSARSSTNSGSASSTPRLPQGVANHQTQVGGMNGGLRMGGVASNVGVNRS